MKRRAVLSTAHSSLSTVAPLALALTGGVGFVGCTAEFKTRCPDGTEQTAGGGDINEACTKIDQQGSAGAGGSGGLPGGGSGGSPGAGSGGGGEIPDGGVCRRDETKCEGESQQTCDAAGQWGPAQACDIACDAAGKACVVPVQLAAGNDHACARLSDGSVRCWGSDQNGTLGNGGDGDQTKPAAVVSLQGAVRIDPSGTCAALSDGSNRCWGSNVFNRLDVSSAPSLQSPSTLTGVGGPAHVALGQTHLCALTEQQTIFCRGDNNFGQLGNDVGILTPTSTGFELSAVQGVSFVPSAIAAAGSTSYALADDGTIFCWGRGENLSCNAAKDVVTNDDAIITTPARVPAVSAVRTLFSGTVPCVVGVDGRVTCWGLNTSGQLGRGTRSELNSPLPPGPVMGLSGALQVSSGGSGFSNSAHVCTVKEDQTLVCWGANQNGQLGNTCGQALPCQTIPGGGASYVPVPSRVPLEGAVEVSAGALFTCARTADSKVYCWGDNSKGQLGNGTKGGAQPKPTAVVWK